MGNLKLSSPEFNDGEMMPEKYGYTRENVNPPLEIDGVPEGAKSLVLIMDDPDALEPAGKVWDHWVVWDMDPEIRAIPEDWDLEGAKAGKTDYGETSYGGPNPPDGVHTYQFRLYALDTELDFSHPPTKDELEEEMEGRVLDQAKLEGNYAPQ
ncbi:MAG: YbhB/YbcL family Raf kinase inhibitor-like protein [Candidatus Acetothermia bacterium]